MRSQTTACQHLLDAYQEKAHYFEVHVDALLLMRGNAHRMLVWFDVLSKRTDVAIGEQQQLLPTTGNESPAASPSCCATQPTVQTSAGKAKPP